VAIALRVDVDTVRGTRDGVPRLLSILERHGVRATWYLTLGPDNMGRHARRLLRPAFLLKMLRSQAASLYGWDILFRGTLWPGTVISRHFQAQLRMPAQAGHEVGVHAWDHHRWQVGVDTLADDALEAQFNLACDAFEDVIGRAPESAAAPGWRCSERVLRFPRSRALRYRSDCRGPARPFRPRVDGTVLDQPQIPVDLPTYDEAQLPASGRDEAWNARLLALIADGKPHVLTVHAESEGGAKAACFDDFLSRATAAGHAFAPLSAMLEGRGDIEAGTIGAGNVPGREGWVCVRTDTLRPS
jgi:undecaprenyl phosphate-alpha-L-ara4FN deformylase